MSKRTFWRFFTTILIGLGCAYFFVPLTKVRLGLDLRGGVHYELEIQGNEALESEARAQARCMETKDFKRAYEAFSKKEKPEFKGD